MRLSTKLLCKLCYTDEKGKSHGKIIFPIIMFYKHVKFDIYKLLRK